MHCPIKCDFIHSKQAPNSPFHLRVQGMQLICWYSKFVSISAVNFCLQSTQVYKEINIKFLFLLIHYATMQNTIQR